MYHPEESFFKRYSTDFQKLKKIGFKKIKDRFVIEKSIKNNLFKAIVNIDSLGCVTGEVYDLENDDEYLPLRVDANQGEFVNEIRNAYEEILKNIRDNCYTKKYFIFEQSNRITNLIIQKYGDEPEFLWEKFKGTGVIRNPKTNKWYIVILDVDRSKIQKDKAGLVEVALLKMATDEVKSLTKQEHFYEGYHMNKKYWITVILDDSVSDEKIMELVEKSYKLVSGKK